MKKATLIVLAICLLTCVLFGCGSKTFTGKELTMEVHDWGDTIDSAHEYTLSYTELKAGDEVYSGYGTITIRSVNEDRIVLSIKDGNYALSDGIVVDLGDKPLKKLTVKDGDTVKIASQTMSAGTSIYITFK